jgi:NAD-dependent dihydropyrimidine dehydrogenase PreA subunit
MKVKRKIVEIDTERCNGCGQCVPACAEGAMQIIDGKARLISDVYCDGLGACLGECPQDALRVVERVAEEFDEAEVEKHLQAAARSHSAAADSRPSGCPSTQAKILVSGQKQHGAAKSSGTGDRQESALSHWPVQIRLVQPGAAFLHNADLLIAADCTPVAYPDFHKDFLQGKAVMIGCPKFDDVDAYIEKFARIFKTANIKSVTVVVMEVPCCQGLPLIVREGMDLAGKNIPIEKIVISAEGEIVQRGLLAA